jgi:gamma-glutamyltranspeptidase/glutathione hydrolase
MLKEMKVMTEVVGSSWRSIVVRFLGSVMSITGLTLGGVFENSESRAADLHAGVNNVWRGAVVTSSPPASDAGMEILQRGGNAVDAAIATALAMAVTFPEAGNIGGGGFMMVWPGQGRAPQCIEYRETAPAAATATMFALGESKFGCKIVGVPGTVRGLALAHQRYGRLPWKTLVLPAVRLAREGFEVDADLAASLNRVLADEASAGFDEMQRVFAPPAGAKWQVGQRLIQAELADTMEQLAEHGPEAFYTGEIADKLVAEMQRGGGLMTKADLAAYRANVREPIRGTYRGHEIYCPPPPSSGGVCLVQMLNMLERFELRTHERWSPQVAHWMLEAMRRSYRDRARHLGDPDFFEVPVARLIDKEYAADLAAGIDPQRATPSEQLAGDLTLAEESENTTHFSVIDADGMAVANTYTLEFSYGSRVVVRGAGFLLNNEMGDFNWKPGHTDRRGNIGSEANTIAPGKRMLSSQTPTIVARDGRAVIVTGSPGGRTIINTVLCVVLNRLEFELPPEEVVAAPRWHHGWFPDEVRFERGADPQFANLLAELRRRGHRVLEKSGAQGDANSIFWDAASERYRAVVDLRRGGKAAQ